MNGLFRAPSYNRLYLFVIFSGFLLISSGLIIPRNYNGLPYLLAGAAFFLFGTADWVPKSYSRICVVLRVAGIICAVTSMAAALVSCN